ncbi:hypothetical protein AB0H77_21815 [Streptomyces sp. NPDC050844]|uniref:hypothetical protein n=1 Tax=Streptomyces sp. NPDC050844 TaxID=3155790 RepID=UPI0033EE6736
MRRLARVATAALLILSGPAATAAIAYDRLNAEWWTDTDTRTTGAAPARPAPEAVPAPSPQAAPEPPRASRHPWPAGSCVTPASVRTPCENGSLRVVASLHAPRSTDPCHDAPETTAVRRAGAYTLCLATL